MDNAEKVNGGGVTSQGSDDRIIQTEREDNGLAALEGLSLEELAAIAAKEIGESRQLQVQAVGLSRRSTVTLYRAGRALWVARKQFKGKGKRSWTKWQKASGIPITSAWQAIRLYEEAESEEAVAGLTRTQALQKYRITKPKKERAKQAPEPVGENIADAPADSPDLRVVAEGDPEGSEEPCAQDELEMEQSDEVEEPQAAPTTPPAAEILVPIVRRLEILEQDSRGRNLDGEALVLIDRAIATLRRLRGDAAPETEAA